MKRRTALLVAGLILAILIVDQVVKVFIKLTLPIGHDPIYVMGLEWFQIRFVENKGMAFGLSFWGETGKYLLSIFRLVFSVAILFYIRKMIKEKASLGYILSISLIVAGAIGNLIDSMFYGLIFSDSYYKIAQTFPDAGGYAGFLQGHVVDMLYFPLFTWPDWIPFFGGDIFFNPIFNIADSSITIGVFIILIFQKRFFKELEKKKELKNQSGSLSEEDSENSIADTSVS